MNGCALSEPILDPGTPGGYEPGSVLICTACPLYKILYRDALFGNRRLTAFLVLPPLFIFILANQRLQMPLFCLTFPNLLTSLQCRDMLGAVRMKLTLAQTATFASLWKYWRLDDDDLRALEHQMMENALAGSVM